MVFTGTPTQGSLMKSKTVNGIGWQVEAYDNQQGWKPLTSSYNNIEEARKMLKCLSFWYPPQNLRVYEVLKGINEIQIST